jgi:hypothetical protein
MRTLNQKLVLLTCFGLTQAIGAEMGPAQLSAQNPADAKAAVPQVNYVSPFQNYKSFSDTKITPWKAANDLTLQIGGWRAYLKEANQPAAAEPTTDMQKPIVPAPPPKAPPPVRIPDTNIKDRP